MSYFNYYLKRKRLHSMGGYCVFRLRCGDTLSTALSYITYRNTWHVILQMGSCCVLSTVTCTSTSANTRPFEFSLVFFFYPSYLVFVWRWGAAVLVALWMWVGGWGVSAQVGLGREAATVLLRPRGDLHGRQLSCVQLLPGQRGGRVWRSGQ